MAEGENGPFAAFPQDNSMRVLLARAFILLVCVLAVSAAPARGQSPTRTSVPRLLRVTGSFRPADGQPEPVETMTLAIYGEKTGGVPLWQERQTVAVNSDGRFTLLMGSTRPEGLPLDLFASGEPRWLAVHVERPGEGEPSRALLANVHSALGDAGASQNQKDVKPALSTGDPKAPIKPKLEDFATREAYEAAKDKYYEDLTDYKVKQAITAEKQRADDLERRLVALEGGKKTQGADASETQTQSADAGQNQKQGSDTSQNQTLAADASQNQTERAKSEPKIKIFGRAQLDVIFNSARPLAPGTPFFMVPKFAGGFTNHTLDINARQSMLGVLFTGPDIGAFHSGGRISAVFFDPTIVADRNGFLLQQSYGELFNDQWRFAAGLQFDVFAPGLPSDLPFSYLGGSGSVGNCIRGQIRVERFLKFGRDSQLTLQGALSEPRNTVNTPDILLDEDNGKPNVEGRIAFGLGKAAPIGLLRQRPIEVGVSGVVGQLRRTAPPTDPPRRVVSDVWGAAVDFQVNLAERYGFKGEMYTGQGIGNYNGAILQSLDSVTWKPIRSTGGFFEGFVYLTRYLHSHTGIGIDDPNNNNITVAAGRTYNSTLYSNLLWDLGGEEKKFRIGFEFTYRQTDYKDPSLSNKGFGLQPQFRWTF